MSNWTKYRWQAALFAVVLLVVAILGFTSAGSNRWSPVAPGEFEIDSLFSGNGRMEVPMESGDDGINMPMESKDPGIYVPMDSGDSAFTEDAESEKETDRDVDSNVTG